MNVDSEIEGGEINGWGAQALRQLFLKLLLNNAAVAALTVVIFYLSLVITSSPIDSQDRETIDRAIALLEAKGFEREVFLLRHTATFRSSDNWLNLLVEKENAYAATNFPLAMITVYPDFFTKAQDDTERAMVLLHEAQHLKGAGEPEAYEIVWRSRRQLGWTQLSHGTTPTFINIELQTREYNPQMFTCPANLWDDCTENLQTRRQAKR
jgi:hypothetical protein